MSSTKKILFPGTFDPITLGHLDVIKQAACCFDIIVIAVSAHKTTKKPPLFSLSERLELIKDCFTDLTAIEITAFTGLTIDAARDCGAQAILRGVRNTTDFAYEAMLAQTNRDMMPEITTLFVLPKPDVAHISSTIVREIAYLGGRVDNLVPAHVTLALKTKLMTLRNVYEITSIPNQNEDAT